MYLREPDGEYQPGNQHDESAHNYLFREVGKLTAAHNEHTEQNRILFKKMDLVVTTLARNNTVIVNLRSDIVGMQAIISTTEDAINKLEQYKARVLGMGVVVLFVAAGIFNAFLFILDKVFS